MKAHSIKLFWIVTILFLFSCSNDDFYQTSQIEASNNEDVFIQSCFNSDDDSTLSTRGVIIRNNKWANGTLVKVKFLNGDATLQAKVKKYAKVWSMHGNIKFLYVGTDKGC